MNTYGLNRHLNSFGLSYPGYWFIVGPDVGGSIPFIAYGTTEYIAYELARIYPAHSITLYEAQTGGGVAVITREFAATEDRNYTAIEMIRLLEARESLRFLTAIDTQDFIAEETTDYIAYESPRAFIARTSREYRL